MWQAAQLEVTLVASTRFDPPAGLGWETDAVGGDALAEFAGRACYQAWDKAVPATASNAGYLRHMLEVGHLAVLEHSSASFYVTGLSRSAAGELTRHRHLSFSQLSRRYLPEGETAVVVPADIAADPELTAAFGAAIAAARAAYDTTLAELTGPASAGAQLAGRQARQAARTLLPTAQETRLVITGNYRAWRHVIAMRASEHADKELRAVAIALLRALLAEAPHSFGDFEITQLADGTEVASSVLAAEG